MQTLYEQEPTTTPLLSVPQPQQQEEQTQVQALATRLPATRKRIVSKGEYAKRQSQRAGQGLMGTGLYVSAIVCGFLAVSLLVVCWQALILYKQETDASAGFFLFQLSFLLVFVLLSALCAGTWFLRKSALRIIKQAKEIDTGVPLTRANIADLPAPDSLVRASQEPAQAQESVLLRASSGEAQPEQEGQLLRASVGESE